MISKEDLPKFVNVRIGQTSIPVNRDDIDISLDHLRISHQAFGNAVSKDIKMKLSWSHHRQLFSVNDILTLLDGGTIPNQTSVVLNQEDIKLGFDEQPDYYAVLVFRPLETYDVQKDLSYTGKIESIITDMGLKYSIENELDLNDMFQ